MNVWDILITAAVVSAVISAVVILRRDKKRGRGCHGNCSDCKRNCK